MLRQRVYSVVGGLLLLAGSSVAFACGIDWELPHSYFDGVDEQGHVLFAEKIADLDLGGDLKLPLYINFKSDRETVSPYLGKGWELSLLESRFVQLSENSFRMYQPDGWYRDFGRDNQNNTVLGGQGGWRAEIKGDVIDAYAPCGWKLAFNKGHISEMTTPKGRKFEFEYNGGVVSAMRENAVTKLATEEEQAIGQVDALVFNDRRLQIAQRRRPRVQAIGDQNLVVGMDQSLGSISQSQEASHSFEFAVNNKLQPTLKITSKTASERLITWDAKTKQIVGDDGWVYHIQSPNGLFANAAIKRANAKQQTEYWFYDGAKGQETKEDITGVTTVRSFFTSGIASGRTRRMQETAGGKAVDVLKDDYNETGQLIRQHYPGHSLYYENGLLTKVIDEGLPFPISFTQNTVNNKH